MAKGFLDGYKTYDTTEGFGSPKTWKKAFNQRMGKEEAEAIMKDGKQMPHGVLGIAANATQVEIKTAFRKLIALWHPDHNQERITEAEEMSKKIIAAYTILRNKK